MFDHTLALAVALVGLGSLAIAWVTLRRQIRDDKDRQRAKEITDAIELADLRRENRELRDELQEGGT